MRWLSVSRPAAAAASSTFAPTCAEGPRAKRLLRAVTSILSLVVSSVLFAADVPAALIDHRPKNFFSAVWQRDKELCQTVLQSLNKEYLIPQELYRVQNPNFIADLLLTSDLEIQWQETPFGSGRNHPEQMDFAWVDLANDGDPVPVFRWDFSDRAGGYQNVLFVPRTVPDEIASNKLSPEKFVARLAGDALRIGRHTSDFWTQDTYPVNGAFVLSILKVGDRAFLLGASSLDATRVAWEGGSFNTFVMEYHSVQNISVVCHFRATAP